MDNKKYVLGYFDDEHQVLHAVKDIRQEKRMDIQNVHSPFPIHGIDDLLGMKRTRIPVMGFCVGITCGILMVVFMSWIHAVNYPLIYGGKPYFAFPSFIPIWFEVTVLTAAFSMFFTFLYSCRLKPSVKNEFNPVWDRRVTDDLFIISLAADKNESPEVFQKYKSVLNENGALRVEEKTLADIGEEED